MKTHDIRQLINSDSEFFTLLRHLPAVGEDGPWIAGGSVWKSIENMPLNCDLDFFFKSAEQCEQWYRSLFALPYSNRIVSDPKFSHFNTSLKYHVYYRGYNKTITIQLVSFKFFKDIEELLNGFDFTACQFGFDGTTLYSGDKSFEDLRNREIIFNNVSDTVATGIHIDKYLALGFKVPESQKEKYEEISKKTNAWKNNKAAQEPATTSILSRWGNVLSSNNNPVAAPPRVTRRDDDDDYEYPRPSSGGLDLSQINRPQQPPRVVESSWASDSPMPSITINPSLYTTQVMTSRPVETVDITIPMDYVTSESPSESSAAETPSLRQEAEQLLSSLTEREMESLREHAREVIRNEEERTCGISATETQSGPVALVGNDTPLAGQQNVVYANYMPVQVTNTTNT